MNNEYRILNVEVIILIYCSVLDIQNSVLDIKIRTLTFYQLRPSLAAGYCTDRS